ncbi:hypothetical protein CARUB_v10022974mg [Capsella rubella]|uniref:TF-B3 domain-containing protein n=1 Tax=Capsella rubella TaxID=81985 RepID=R0FW98_9BRAS|nr:B3 domain-containing protein REM10 [Capsella rubella]EOA26881.1 hypothetical protein CARUB_v10022974mg [Capsella rubella]
MVNQPLYSPINPHFFQPLLPGYSNHLDIPVAFFLKHLVGSNEGKTTAELRSDASEKITWKVKIDGRRLSHGWDGFVIAHDLRVGDIVVFRHEGELVFHVSALGPSCCQIQYTEDKREKKQSLKREAADSEPDHSLDSCFVLTVTASNLRRDTVYLPKGFARSNGLMNKYQIVLINEKGESWTIDLRHELNPSVRFNMRRGWRSFCVANGKKPGDLIAFKLVQNEETPVLKLFPMDSEVPEILENLPRKRSGRSEVDDSPDCSSFVARVTTSNLSRDRMYLPKTFIESNGLLKKFQMLLMNEEGESWKIDVKHEAYSGRFLTIRGWKSFCLANGKKPGDSFTFKLVENDEVPVLRLFPFNSEDSHKVEPSNDTRQGKCLKATKKEFLGVEATEKEFLGVEVRRNDSTARVEEPTNDDRRKAIKQEYVSTKGNSSRSQNRLVTLTLTPASKLNLPLEFMKAIGINKAGKITMVDRYGGRWSTPLLMDKRSGTMSLGRGSKGFCEINGVKMNESFVLELIWEDTVPILKFCSKV